MSGADGFFKGLLKVVVVEPGKFPYEKTIEDDLESLKATIGGGYIETFHLGNTFPQLAGIIGICDEEGKRKELRPNFRQANGDVVVGTFFLCRSKPPNFASLSDLDAQRVIAALTFR